MGKMGSREEKKIQKEKEVPFVFILTIPIRLLLVLLFRRGKEKEKEQTQSQETAWSVVSIKTRGKCPLTPQKQASKLPQRNDGDHVAEPEGGAGRVVTPEGSARKVRANSEESARSLRANTEGSARNQRALTDSTPSKCARTEAEPCAQPGPSLASPSVRAG